MQRFDVMIRCTSQRLPIILQALDGAMELISVKAAVEDVDVPGLLRRKTHGYVNGKHDKGISGKALALELLNKTANGSMGLEKMSKAFQARGFALSSASPVLSALVKTGVCEKLGHGTYRLIKKATP